MKEPPFSLQKILNFREFQKKQAEIELGKAISEVTRINQTLEMVAKQRVSAMRETDKTANADPLAMFHAARYYKFLDNKKEELLTSLTKAEMVVDEKREVFKDALKKQKVLENLKEKKHEEWKQEEKHREQKAIDDIVNAKYN